MSIAAVDMLIPPSALTVLLGSLSGISISKLLIGGVVPGLLLSVALLDYIVGPAQREPQRAWPIVHTIVWGETRTRNLAPHTPVTEHAGWEDWRLLVLYVAPLVAIFAV